MKNNIVKGLEDLAFMDVSVSLIIANSQQLVQVVLPRREASLTGDGSTHRITQMKLEV